MYLVLASLCCSVLLYFFQSTAVFADPLMGDVAAANASLSAVEANPASAAFLDRTQVSWSPELFKTETIYARYPGFESASLADNGMGSLLSKPAFIYKPNSRLSIGGYAIPPLPIKINIKKENLPVMLLGTLNYVDIVAKGSLKGAGQALIGYRVSNSFGVGVNANFQSVGFNAELIPSDGGDSLADVTGSFTTITSNLGFRYELTSKIAVGFSFGLFSQKSTELKIDSPLMSQAGGAGPGGNSGSGGGTVTSPADNFLVGIEAALNAQTRFLLDLQYARANKSETTFSLVDLADKKRDVYDTLAVRAGMSLGVTPTNSALVGYRYEPSNLGPGSPGPDGTAGFGTIDLVTMFAGFDTLKPYSQYSLGLKMLAGWVSERSERPSSKKRAAEVKEKGFHAYEISFGLVYRIASLGIDENGELPGAYLQKKTFIPLTVLRKF